MDAFFKAIGFIASERLGIAGRYYPPLTLSFESLNGIFTWNYIFALKYAHGVTVDVGCSTGYGTEKVCEKADFCVGVDISRKALYRAVKRKKENMSFILADCHQLPIRSGSVDCVLSFEIIEHLEKPEVFLENIRSLLKNVGGILILSTPIKREAKQFNPFHNREYSTDEINKMVKKLFKNQSLIYGKEIVYQKYLVFRKSLWGRTLFELKKNKQGSFLAVLLERFLFPKYFKIDSFKLSKRLDHADNQILVCRI